MLKYKKCLLNFVMMKTSWISWSEITAAPAVGCSVCLVPLVKELKMTRSGVFEEGTFYKFFFLIYNGQVWSLICCKKGSNVSFLSLLFCSVADGTIHTMTQVKAGAWMKLLTGSLQADLKGSLDISFICLCKVVFLWIYFI